RKLLVVEVAFEVVLGKKCAVIWRRGIFRNHFDLARETTAEKHIDCGIARGPAADDNELLTGLSTWTKGMSPRNFGPLQLNDPTVDLNFPTRYWIKRRRRKCLASIQA